MSQATFERVEVVAKPRFQASLWGLASLVVAAAVYFALVRGAHGFWIGRGVASKLPVLDIDRVLVLPVMALGTLIAFVLLAESIRLLRPRAVAEGPRVGFFSVVWRGLAAPLLGSMMLGLSAVVTSDPDRDRVGLLITQAEDWKGKLGALTLGIALIGLLIGATPSGARRRRPLQRRRWVLPSVVFAGLTGLLILTFYGSLYPYLVLLALEAVSNAMMRPALSFDRLLDGHQPAPIFLDRSLWPSLEVRLNTAGISAGMGLILCLLTACWLSRDLRASTSEREIPRSWFGVLYRGLTAAGTWGMGGYLLLKTLPALHPSLAEGFANLLHPGWTFAIAVSFLTLAAGLSARGLAGAEAVAVTIEPASTPRLRWIAWPLKIAAAFVLSTLILAAVARIRGTEVIRPWYVPILLSDWLDYLVKPLTITTSGATYFDPSLTPDALIVLGGTAWISLLAVRYLVANRRSLNAPLDVIGSDRRLFGRFLGTWFALSGVMLTLFPALFLAGMAVFHLVFKAVYP